MKFWKAAAIAVAIPASATALTWLWSFDYAGIYVLVLKSTFVFNAFFHGEWKLPIEQALAYTGDPRIHRVITLATAAAVIQATVLGALIYLLTARPWIVRPPSDGSRIANRKDLVAAGLIGGTPGKSILLGTFGSRKEEVRYSGDSHFFVNGPSRSGKGRGFVMVNLLEWQGSAIVLDVKKENFNHTGAARLALGQKVYLFAPGSAVSHRWNPLDFVRPWPARATDLSNLAASFIVMSDKEDTIWKGAARALLAGILGYILESETMEGRRHLRSALSLFSTDKPFPTVLTKILADDTSLNPYIANAFRQHLGHHEEQRPSFETHVKEALKAWNNLLIASATSGSDFDIRKLRSEPFTLYIAAPVSDFGTVEPIIRLLIQQIHDIMLRDLPSQDEPHKVLLLLDEFYQFERLPEVIRRAPLVAGYGLTIALVAQNIPQIDERYTQKTRDALLGNMDIQLYVAVGDETTARLVSENMGRQYVEREGWKTSVGISSGRRASGGRFEAVPVRTPDQVSRLDAEETILQVRGSYSAVLSKMNFYTQPKFVRARAAVEHLSKNLPNPRLTEIAEWPLFEPRPQEQAQAQLSPRAKSNAVDSTGRMILDPELAALAGRVFVDPAKVLTAIEVALNAPTDEAVTELLRTLRARPIAYGERRSPHPPAKMAWRKTEHADDDSKIVWRLRDLVISARRQIIADRARKFSENDAELGVLRAVVVATDSRVPTAQKSDSSLPSSPIDLPAEQSSSAVIPGALRVEAPPVASLAASAPQMPDDIEYDEPEVDVRGLATSSLELEAIENIATNTGSNEQCGRASRFREALAGIQSAIALGVADNLQIAIGDEQVVV